MAHTSPATVEGIPLVLHCKDRSPAVLAVSGALSPECEHLQSDMRSVRLARRFDVVQVHDAILCLTSAHDLKQAVKTCSVHCRSGGATLFVPDIGARNP